jgi:hypothetical protein
VVSPELLEFEDDFLERGILHLRFPIYDFGLIAKGLYLMVHV